MDSSLWLMKMTTNNPFKTINLVNIFLDPRNFEPLEHLFESEEMRVKELSAKPIDPYDKRIPSIEEVRGQIFPAIKKEVAQILEFDRDLSITVEYSDNPDILNSKRNIVAIYLGMIKKIKTKIMPLNILLSALAHEYVHAIQHDNNVNLHDAHGNARGELIVQEGMACGIEAKLSEQFLNEQKCKSATVFSAKQREGRLGVAYLMLCSYLRKTPKKEHEERFSRFLPFKESDEDLIKRMCIHNKHYFTGTAFFALSELKHGPSVYARALRRDEGILQLH